MGLVIDESQVRSQGFLGAVSLPMETDDDGAFEDGGLAANRLLALVEQVVELKKGEKMPHRSQRAIAQKLGGIDPSYISGLWNGTRVPSIGLTVITKIDRGAGIRPEYFTGRIRGKPDYRAYLRGEDPFKDGWSTKPIAKKQRPDASPHESPAVHARAAEAQPVGLAVSLEDISRAADKKGLGMRELTALMAHVDAMSKHTMVTKAIVEQQIEALAPRQPEKPRPR